MAKTPVTPSREILEAALHGLEAQRHRLDEQIAQVRAMMGRRVGRPPKAGTIDAITPFEVASVTRRKRTLSPEARKRIAAAQKKRWANYRKADQS